MLMIHRRRTSCRICGDTRLERFLTLGSMPLANGFLASTGDFADEPSFPLDLFLCGTCSLVQLADVIDPRVLFRHYLYVSGTSDTIGAHNRDLAASICDRLGLTERDLAVEIASNDGSLLKCFKTRGVRVLGIEPARNIAAAARASGIETVDEFFNSKVADRVCSTHGRAAVVIANNVLAHVDDPAAFLAAARSLLRPGGVVVVEVPYVRELLDRFEYDTVYHEHLSYFSVTALRTLAEHAGLALTRVDRVTVHGGSVRVWFQSDDEPWVRWPQVEAMAAEERDEGIGGLRRWADFASGVERSRRELRALLEDLQQSGHRIAAYGAPAKGNTLLNYCGIDTRLVSYVVDKNPLKVGMFTPGTHIPVRPVSALADDPPDYLMILAWNFADEIIRQQSSYQAGGGRFIIPVPRPVIV